MNNVEKSTCEAMAKACGHGSKTCNRCRGLPSFQVDTTNSGGELTVSLGCPRCMNPVMVSEADNKETFDLFVNAAKLADKLDGAE